MTQTIVRGVLALGVCGVVAPAVLALLRWGQVLDHPTERSSHTSPVPRGGGVALAVGALVALSLTPEVHGRDRLAIAVAASAFGLLGLVDDVIGVRALHRLAIQFVAAGFAGAFLLDALTGHPIWRVILAAGVVLWLVAFVNACNFMDGINGISVAQAVGAGAVWLLVGTMADSPVLAAGGAIIAGAALGFAPFNMVEARMFLGDVGSYFLGAWLAALAVVGVRSGVPLEAVLAPLALYAADTGTTLVSRVLRGETWYLPHRSHAYQRLGDGGWSHMRTSTFVAACILACGALGAVSLSHSLVFRVAADAAIMAVVGVYLYSPTWIARSRSTVAAAT